MRSIPLSSSARRVMTALTAGLVVLAAVVLGAGRPASAIAQGDDAPLGKYPFAVKITDLDIPTADGGTRDSACSGGLISPRWVLTAGHCFKNINGEHVSRTVARKTIATIGRTDLTGDDGYDIDIVAVKQAKGGADVALAKLKKPVFEVTPLKLGRKKPKIGTEVRLTGFGLTDGEAKKLPKRMQTGTFEVVSVTGKEMGVVGSSPAETTSACKHDSGGPYFTEGDDGTATVVGVVSHGPTCPHASTDQAGRIDNLVPWIQSIIGKDLQSSPKPKPSPSDTVARAAGAKSEARPAGSVVDGVPIWVWVAVPVVLLGTIGLVAAAGAGGHKGKRRRRG